MKKVYSIIPALIITAVLLGGCGNKGAAETPTPTTEPTAAAVTDTADICRGTVTGDIYTSEYSGISIKLPEGWSFATDEEFAADTGASLPLNGGAVTSAELSALDNIYDVMIKSTDGENLVIMYDNLQRYGDSCAAIDESVYMDMVKAGLDADGTYSYTVGDYYTKAIDGSDYLMASVSLEGYSITQLYSLRRIDDFMLCMIYTGYDSGEEITGG